MSEISDHLSARSNPKVQKMLHKVGNGSEQVVFSDFVIKINRKGKFQRRCIIITDAAVYNIMPNRWDQVKRRIKMTEIAGVTVSDISDEFVLHVPEEYDYRYKSSKKDQIVTLLREAVRQEGKEDARLAVNKAKKASLGEETVTRQMSRMQTRAEKLRRKQMLAAIEHESDNEDRDDVNTGESRDEVVEMFNTKNKVRLKDFELLKVLGRGAFGKVMLVKKRDDGKLYAMKILRKAAIIEKNQVEHTKAERSILQQLQHPFLMTLRFAFQTKEKLYLVLDYYQGGELFFHLKAKKRFTEQVARVYIAEIALAFDHLHTLNVVYRDLKPENVLLDDEGHVCLTDFGLAKEMQDGDKTTTFCGTPEYLAPEIVQNRGHDKMVDWWSLGILLYELTVGIPPFYHQNVHEMYNKIQNGVLKFPTFLTDPCKELILGLLQRNPKKRLCSKDGVEELKRMSFFASMDWNALYKKDIIVGFKPTVGDANDVSNFDDEFVHEPVVDSVVQPNQMVKGKNNEFSDFTYSENKSALR